ncbi:hypothetical protein GCM10010360_55470 [Streptomyces nogalater]
MVGDGTVHDGPDDGIQAGAVAAGREDTNTHSPNYLLNVGRVTGPRCPADSRPPYRREGVTP